MSATATQRPAASRRATANTALSGPSGTQPGTRCIRCAIYTRKSTEEGLDQEFNSLDAQRESAVAYIASQKNEGWSGVPDRYDDGGFTGGNMDRPALKRLIDDIEAGKVNCVVVYKVDRLSRSLMDLARLMELFDRKGVSFVSVTQQFNTTHSMGRLTLNILLSFAQFEREIISERTRDKIASARRKGKYQHGKPILGYDFVPAPAPFTGRRLVVNKIEAERVRRMFELYLELESILRVADECNSRGWTTKSWTTTAGRTVGNREFDKSIISRLLRNPLYLGKVPHNGAVYDGEHEAIIDEDLFRRVQAQLNLAGERGGASMKNSTGSLLGGLVRCKGCGCAMSPSSASKVKPDGTRIRYRYYVCSSAVKRGRQHCASPSLPGPALEAFVLDQVKAILADSPQMSAVVARAIDLLRDAASARIAEQARLRAVLERLSGEEPTAATRREIERVRRTLGAVSAQVAADADRLIDEDEVAGAAEAFDGVWNAMTQAGPICAAENILNHERFEVGVRELIVQGFLSPLRTKAGLQKISTDDLHVRAGEFDASEVEDLMDKDGLVEGACAEIVEHTKDRNATLIFASGIRHGQHIVEVLKAKHGVECGFVSGDAHAGARSAILGRFRSGDLKYLCNMNVLTTGFDAPHIDCVALVRPTMSPGLYYQMVGRGFRLHPGKADCLVLDFGGNVLRHGPVDAVRLDTFDRGEGEAPAKECPQCQALIAAGYQTCPQCDHQFPEPNKQKHEAQASTEGILSGQNTRDEHHVSETTYHVHMKRTDPSAPLTMRVEYRVGFNQYFREWVCFDHTGYARTKAEAWWGARSVEPLPGSTEEAVEMAKAGALAPTLHITVERKAGDQFERVVAHRLGDKPPRLDSDEGPPEAPAQPVGTTYGIPDEEIPF